MILPGRRERNETGEVSRNRKPGPLKKRFIVYRIHVSVRPFVHLTQCTNTWLLAEKRTRRSFQWRELIAGVNLIIRILNEKKKKKIPCRSLLSISFSCNERMAKADYSRCVLVGFLFRNLILLPGIKIYNDSEQYIFKVY